MADPIEQVQIPENSEGGQPAEQQDPAAVLSSELAALRRPRRVYAGMWGTPEIVAVAAGALLLVGAILLYVVVVIPSNRELAKNSSEAARLEAERLSANTKYGEINDTEKQVGKLLTSADDFETRFLPASSNGRGALYERLNGLIAAYSLTNTTGPAYAPLEPAEQKVANQSEEDRGREKFRSLFPGVYVTMTVEGSYQNLRRFIGEIETGNEFVIISSIELSPSDTEDKKTNAGAPPNVTVSGATTGGPVDPSKMGAPSAPMGPPQSVAPQKPQGKTHGETVALRLEMAAYFRRANYSSVAPPTVVSK